MLDNLINIPYIKEMFRPLRFNQLRKKCFVKSFEKNRSRWVEVNIMVELRFGKTIQIYFFLELLAKVPLLSKFLLKLEIVVKNRNSYHKSKFWTNIKILDKHRNFGQVSQFWTNIEIFSKNRNFELTSKFLTNIEIFCQKSKFWTNIQNFAKNRSFVKTVA